VSSDKKEHVRLASVMIISQKKRKAKRTEKSKSENIRHNLA
jgi:hypothetical protein